MKNEFKLEFEVLRLFDVCIIDISDDGASYPKVTSDVQVVHRYLEKKGWSIQEFKDRIQESIGHHFNRFYLQDNVVNTISDEKFVTCFDGLGAESKEPGK